MRAPYLGGVAPFIASNFKTIVNDADPESITKWTDF
jgi:hypothetical protein